METPDWASQYEEFKNKYKDWKPTELTPEEEPKFKDWFYNTKLFNNLKELIAQDMKVPLDTLTNDQVAEMLMEEGDYDYKGAWKKGTEEVISPYDNMPHWTDKAPDGSWLKSPSHPTAWKEFFMQQYRIDPDELGLDTYEKAIKAQIETPFYQDPFGDTTK